MISMDAFEKLQIELSLKSKNGMDFILAASIIWLAISYVWTLELSSYNKSVLTFIVGSFMFPLAILFSKILRTKWTLENNPLQPLGLWLNFAQLFYFPFLIFTLIKMPDHFVMVYVVITGAHFFPYAWFFKAVPYAVMAGVISVGAMFIELIVKPEDAYLVPLFMSGSLLVLLISLYALYRNRKVKYSLTE